MKTQSKKQALKILIAHYKVHYDNLLKLDYEDALNYCSTNKIDFGVCNYMLNNKDIFTIDYYKINELFPRLSHEYWIKPPLRCVTFYELTEAVYDRIKILEYLYEKELTILDKILIKLKWKKH